MNFDLSEEEGMLKALAERFVTDRYDPEQRRGYLARDRGYAEENWTILCELGLVSALFDESVGGLGIGNTGLCTVFEALGRGLVVEPLAESGVIAGRLLLNGATDALPSEWKEGVVAGKRRVALAHREYAARRNHDFVATRARMNGVGMIISGAKSFVPAGAGADAYIVSARTDGADGERGGVALFLVPADVPGLSVRPWRIVDGGVAVSLELRDVVVDPSFRLTGGLDAIVASMTQGMLLHCAEALGIMERLHAETLEYLRTRKQFGVSLGSFQALQHRMVAQYAVLEQTRALLMLAMIIDPADVQRFNRAVYGARAYMADAAVPFGHEMIQMHGGMGVTDELLIGHGHKRLVMLSRWPEEADATLDRYAAG